MQLKQLNITTTLDGKKVIIADAVDDNAPLIKLEFCNEYSTLSEEVKVKLGVAVQKELYKLGIAEHLNDIMKRNPNLLDMVKVNELKRFEKFLNN